MKENKNYPETYEKFLEWFKTENDCIEYISRIKWSEGFKCPKCSFSKAWHTKSELIHFFKCGHQTSNTAGEN